MAICLARHGARRDFEWKERGENWQLSAEAAARPWDPPLSEEGLRMGAALGRGVKARLEALGAPPVARVVSSPFLRCVQTAAAAAAELGVKELALEPGLSEGMPEDWYRSWALVPGSDSTWGGPAHAPVGTPLPEGTALHPSAHVPAHLLLLKPAEAAAALAETGVTSVTVDGTFESVAPPPDYAWDTFETSAGVADRVEHTVRALAARFPHESILACSHGGPCGHALRRFTGDTSEDFPLIDYTALSVFRPGPEDGAAWACPVQGDTGHLKTYMAEAPSQSGINDGSQGHIRS